VGKDDYSDLVRVVAVVALLAGLALLVHCAAP
jgi:hypothetical protein